MSLALIDEIFRMGEIKVLSNGTFVLFAFSNLDILNFRVVLNI